MYIEKNNHLGVHFLDVVPIGLFSGHSSFSVYLLYFMGLWSHVGYFGE